MDQDFNEFLSFIASVDAISQRPRRNRKKSSVRRGLFSLFAKKCSIRQKLFIVCKKFSVHTETFVICGIKILENSFIIMLRVFAASVAHLTMQYTALMKTTDAHYEEIISAALSLYKKHKRSLPWRKTNDPYHVLISEYMLQQTQVERVVPKFEMFVKKFPDVFSLANAERREVLALWSGLGYNRRAIALSDTAKLIANTYDGAVPNTREELITLPGVGEYTASAVLAFAYNRETVMIETNIRTVVLHHCFNTEETVSDSAVHAVIAQLSDIARKQKISPRVLYTALMDYGAHLKKSGVRINSRSKGYKKQGEVRGINTAGARGTHPSARAVKRRSDGKNDQSAFKGHRCKKTKRGAAKSHR